jgi:ribonuclease J
LICSSQNIDRIVSAYRACLRTGKILIIDIYTAWILEKLKEISNNVPAMEWQGVRVYADYNQDRVLKMNKDYFGDFRKRVYVHRIHKEEIKSNPSQYLVISKMSKFKTIDSYRGNTPVNVIYSQWKGYLKCSNAEYYGAEKIRTYQEDKEINFVYAHTSGHATVKDLQTFAAALKAPILVPVHTEYKHEFKNYFANVVEMEDGIPLLL